MPSISPSNVFSSAQNVNALAGGVSDIFAGFGDLTRAAGAEAEGQSYEEAAALARQNEQYTQMSTAIQVAQKNRELNLSLGRTQAEVAGAGFSLSGSGLDILRESASQGALSKAVTSEQGLITEASYKEQAQSYDLMAQAANSAAKGDNLAAIGSFGAAGISALASMVAA